MKNPIALDKDVVVRNGLFLVAFSAIAMLALITVFIFKEGISLFLNGVSPWKFISGTDWLPTKNVFGIFPMIIGSIYVTVGALVIGVPLGIACAIFMSEIAPGPGKLLKPAVEVLAGIPSVVYGFIGLISIVPFIRERVGGPGLSILAASIILGIMILPTVTSISYDAIMAVPRSYRLASFAVGATHWQTIVRVVLPAASSGIMASVILGIGRAFGETMAVIMVIGNAPQIPRAITEPARTLTSNIALEMGYASGAHQQALFSTGIILFIMIMALNSIGIFLRRRMQ